jgi:hypothetical protein
MSVCEVYMLPGCLQQSSVQYFLTSSYLPQIPSLASILRHNLNGKDEDLQGFLSGRVH